jgi:DNA-directed RNA polymerase specialized sigma24 family protein
MWPKEEELNLLPEKHSQAIRAVMKHKTYQDASTATSIPVGSLKSRVHRGRAMVIRNRANQK